MRKYTVLCIDDDYPTNVYNEVILSESNLLESYKIFNNGIEALRALENIPNKPDLLLVDINMPKMDGWSFIKALKDQQVENEEEPYLIYMLTTSSSPLDQAKSEEYTWVKGVMEKPLTEEMLEQALKQVQQQ